jgi:hypothetical protein
MSKKANNLSYSLPWEIITRFLNFDEILKVRVVSQAFRQCIEDCLSSDFCSRSLFRFLEERNIYLVSGDLENFMTLATQSDEIDDFFLTETSNYFNKLLLILRVLRYLPKSVVVAFNGKYGRHCIPIQWDDQEKDAILQSFSPCEREQCPTCSLKLPSQSPIHSTYTNNIYDYLEFHNKRGVVDLHQYVPKCIPNLPADLRCPNCLVTNQRTLILSEFSYKSESGGATDRPSHTLLTWTPKIDADVESSSDSGEQVTKRQKVEFEERYTRNPFPPMFDDMAVPVRTQPLRLKSDCKFAISIHCSSCQKFQVFAPSAVCWNNAFRCEERGKQHGYGKYHTIVGGVLVRQQCSSPDCLRPVSCPHCAHNISHRGYDDEEQDYTVIRKSNCASCNLTFCDEHAWLSTICHHS